ncbi:testis development protein prtd [Holotrichia oblita]|uniref:Testis development protein prtd n=1 Tax=Holotrichia oblita TaxID=644536 RepID=A0ACB9SXZ7_HOLOL|nr:testis development protein prtd [Holotrichia oblita]
MNNYIDYVNSSAIVNISNTEVITNGTEKKKKVSFEPNLSEKELNNILMEHCYSRPHNRTLESRFLRPTKTLFIPQRTSRRKSTNPLAPIQDYEDVIDIETVPPDQPIIYDAVKAKHLMEECERHASFARSKDEDHVDWEEKINRLNWSHMQNRVFNSAVNIMNNDYMARLAVAGSHNEPIVRRNIIDKSVARFRQLMASVLWDTKLAQWLHVLLLDNLSTIYLTIYLDILQTLKSKLPTFIDKMMYGPVSNNRVGITSNESLYPLLKRAWDPVAPSLNQDKPKKLPGNPIIIVVPSAPFTTSANQFKRLHKWINLLSNLATVITVYTNIGTTAQRMTMTNCLDQMFAATRGKIQEVKEEYPGRSIILAGFNSGASLALQVAQVEPILCVLCLGFSLLTAEGRRGDPDDNLLELQCPVLFVIGQCSNTSLQEDMEDLRERMRVETGLIVVGSADDYLRVSKKKKRSECITQSVVDRCIVDEVGEFVSGLLLSPYPPQIRMSPAQINDANKGTILERKRNNSNGSSVDSEPSSPTPRITRPGHINLSSSFGRPPGSKSKMKSKWTLQIPPGTSSSPSPSTSPTPLSLSESHLNDISTPKSPIHDNIDIQTQQDTSDFKRKSSEAAGMPIPYRGSTPSTQIKQTSSGIKVLENVSLNAGNAKFLSNSGRAIDLSKITILNSTNQHKSANTYGNIVIMSDGKAKTTNPQMKEVKYITSKKQLMGARPPKPSKKMPYMSAASNLSLPTNLTSQDIMDLPIIFADDNQMLANNMIQPNDTPAPNIAPIQSSRNSNSSKIVFINKQVSVPATNVFSPATVKRQSAPLPVRNSNSVKYAKIILSKRSLPEDAKISTNSSVGTDISGKKGSPMPTDIESQLVAAAVPNPNFNKIDSSSDMTNTDELTDSPQKPQLVLNDILGKRLNDESDDEVGSAKKIKLDSSPSKL